MEPLVEIKNLSIRFPEGNSTFEAVKGISFSIGKGEIVGVVGESGSGKSLYLNKAPRRNVGYKMFFFYHKHVIFVD